MKTSELIQRLQAALRKHGDLHVGLRTGSTGSFEEGVGELFPVADEYECPLTDGDFEGDAAHEAHAEVCLEGQTVLFLQTWSDDAVGAVSNILMVQYER